MRKLMLGIAAVAALSLSAAPAYAQKKQDKSSGRKAQERGMREIPRCAKSLGTISIVEPEEHWWTQYGLGSPEAVIKVFVQQSGCFSLVNRGRAMQSRAMERALAEQGELQRGSNMGAGQVKAADFFLEPNLVSGNRDSGGGNVAGALGGLLGGRVGAVVGGINIKKKEANVTLSMVNARTTEEWVTEGYSRKTDIGWGAGGGAGWWGGFAAVGGGGYQNTEIGQVIVLAYLDAYIKMVQQLGGLPPGDY